MGRSVISASLPCVAGVALLGLAACGKLGVGQDEMTWARAALERNERIEVIAADPQTRTFTVRVKDTGELRMVRADQVVASPPFSSSSQASGRAAAQGAGGSGVGGGGSGNAGAIADVSAGQNPGSDAWPNPGPSPGSNPGPNPESSADDTAASAEDRAAAATVRLSPDPATAGRGQSLDKDRAAGTVGGRFARSGPGYSIKIEPRAAALGPRVERDRSSASTARERHHEPIICKGGQLLHIDNRDLEFDGDAITAQDGCELHITNSHIIAKGIAVAARGTANVHIANSQIEGDAASLDAADEGQIYAEGSTFKGMRRRLDNSALHDLGGNVWN